MPCGDHHRNLDLPLEIRKTLTLEDLHDQEQSKLEDTNQGYDVYLVDYRLEDTGMPNKIFAGMQTVFERNESKDRICDVTISRQCSNLIYLLSNTRVTSIDITYSKEDDHLRTLGVSLLH